MFLSSRAVSAPLAVPLSPNRRISFAFVEGLSRPMEPSFLAVGPLMEGVRTMRWRYLREISILLAGVLLFLGGRHVFATTPESASATVLQERITRPSGLGEEIVPALEGLLQLGGSARAMDVLHTPMGDTLYLGAGNRIVAYDMSEDPPVERRSATIEPVSEVRDIKVAGNHVYVISSKGLHIFSLDLQEIIAAKNSQASGVDAQGNQIYMTFADGTGIVLLDASSPAPDGSFVKNSHDLFGKRAYDVAVDGDRVYVATEDGVIVLEATSLKVVDTLDVLGGVVSLAVADDQLFVARGRNGVLILDKNDLTEIGMMNTPGIATSVAVQDDELLIADKYAGVQVVDISDLSNPEQLSTLSAPGFGNANDALFGLVGGVGSAIAAFDGGLFWSTEYTGSNPMGVTQPISFPDAWRVDACPGSAAVLSVVGKTVGVIEGPLGEIDTGPLEAPVDGQPWDVAVPCGNGASPDAVYVAAGEEGLNIFDLSGDITLTLTHTIIGANWAGGVAADEDRVGAATGPDGVYLFRYEGTRRLHRAGTSGAAGLRELGSYDTPGSALDLEIVGDLLYVADDTAGLRIIDFTDPAQPVEVGAFPTGQAQDLTVVEGRVYVAAVGDGLRIIDVSDPATPVQLGVYDTPGFAVDVAVIGGLAYVADSGREVLIIDVRDPTQPGLVGTYEALGRVSGLSAAGNYLYVAATNGGLLVLWGAPATRVAIPPGGGDLYSEVDRTRYTFPSGLLTSGAVITHTPRPPENMPGTGALLGIGHFFEVSAATPDGQTIQPSPGAQYTVVIDYSDAGVAPDMEGTLALYGWDGTAWTQQGINSTVDAANDRLMAEVDRFGLFAVLAEARRVFIPLAQSNPG